MRKTLEVYRSIAEQAADSIFVTDHLGIIIYQNPEARRAFGFSDDELADSTVREAIHHHEPNGNPVLQNDCKVFRAATFGETARDFIWMVFRKDGSWFYASCTSSPIYFEGERIGALLFATDITARKNAEDELVKSSEKLKLATEATELGLFDFAPGTEELVWTDWAKRHFGLPPETQVTYETFLSGIHPDDRTRVSSSVDDGHNGKRNDGRYQYEYRTISPVDARIRWLSVRGRTFFDEEGKAVRIVGTTMDITDRKLADIRLREALQHDSLTGLPNRALLAEYCDHMLAQAARVEAESAVLFIDLDRFKPINDLYGHETGDKVLQEVARRLQACTRREDIVSRLGGDEFIIVLPRIQSEVDPETVAQHILDELIQPIRIGEQQLTLSASIGISIFRQHASDLESLIRCADLAMYSAKQEGPNSVRLYTPGHDERASNRLRLEIHLKHKIETNGMVLFYQPIIDVASKRLIGAEALVRMPGEDGVLMQPEEFIPLAESTGLIGKLGHWVSAEACRQHGAWRAVGLPPFSIAVNVSAIEFRQRSFAPHLTEILKQSDMDPTCFQIELTESTVMSNLNQTIATLHEIRSIGIKVALDDFGTGYSSLSHLRKLPLDKLKIDQSFINRIESDELNQSISDAIIGLGRTMNLQVVGEGIESAQAMHYLHDHGCDQAQGFLFSEPLPAREFEIWCREYVQRFH
ncbi:hypothetical protein BH11PSE11_BH11PSE11_22270 [soil metagenome]